MRLEGLLLVLIMSVGNADTDRVALMLTGGFRTFAKVWPTVEKHGSGLPVRWTGRRTRLYISSDRACTIFHNFSVYSKLAHELA